MHSGPRPARRAYLAWLAVCLVWGTTYLAIRIALESIPPLLMAGFRWCAAGAVLIAWFHVRNSPLPRVARYPALAARGLLLIGFGNGAVVWAEQTVPSGLTAVLVAVVPFWMVAIDALAAGRRPDASRVMGLVLGFAGVVLLVGPELRVDVGRTAFLHGLAATQLACLGWAIGSAAARREGDQERLPTDPALEMLFGGVILTVAGVTAGEWGHVTVTARTGTAFVYLIVFGSIVAFSAYRYALERLPIATVSLYAYINTVIAVLLGAWVLHEPLNWRIAVGAVVVLAGVALVREPAIVNRAGSNDAAPTDQSHQEQHDRDNQQHVNEVAEGVAADDP